MMRYNNNNYISLVLLLRKHVFVKACVGLQPMIISWINHIKLNDIVGEVNPENVW